MACCHLLVPVKRLALAKSRLGDNPRRAELALAFAADAVSAAVRCPSVATVTVISDDPVAVEQLGRLGALVVADVPDAGLNPALAHAAASLPADCWIGALSADLPALRPAELAAAIDEAQSAGAPDGGYVPDHRDGTTLLLRPPGRALDPKFGPASARAHAATGAVALGVGLAGLRTDVDTPADLEHALRIGVGEHTTGVLAAAEAQPH
jgi:2-phospho-L-lactate/phosphoenolpyruvate guanylyltransferase